MYLPDYHPYEIFASSVVTVREGQGRHCLRCLHTLQWHYKLQWVQYSTRNVKIFIIFFENMAYGQLSSRKLLRHFRTIHYFIRHIFTVHIFWGHNIRNFRVNVEKPTLIIISVSMHYPLQRIADVDFMQHPVNSERPKSTHCMSDHLFIYVLPKLYLLPDPANYFVIMKKGRNVHSVELNYDENRNMCQPIV